MHLNLSCPGNVVLKIKTMNILYFSLFISVISTVSSVFNFEELRKTNYGLEILDKPVVIPNEISGTRLLVTSVHGQQYQCNYPEVSYENNVNEVEKEAFDTGVSELLKPMAEGPCLTHTKGWWTYEFCFGKEIKQYHLHEGKISGEVTNLGRFESEFDWDDDQQEDEKKRRILNRYHSQHYVNGSKCDLTKKPRTTEVRFSCEEDKGDYVYQIDEPSTCTYIIYVHTMKICHHPFLKPPTPKVPVSISCSPVLSAEDYREYLLQMKEEEEDRIRKSSKLGDSQTQMLLNMQKKHNREEFILKNGQLQQINKEDTTQQQEIISKFSEKEGWKELLSSEDESEETKLSKAFQDIDKAFSEALTKTMQDILGDDQVRNGEMKMKFKVFKDMDEIKDAIHKFKENKGSPSAKDQIFGRHQAFDDDENEGIATEDVKVGGKKYMKNHQNIHDENEDDPDDDDEDEEEDDDDDDHDDENDDDYDDDYEDENTKFYDDEENIEEISKLTNSEIDEIKDIIEGDEYSTAGSKKSEFTESEIQELKDIVTGGDDIGEDANGLLDEEEQAGNDVPFAKLPELTDEDRKALDQLDQEAQQRFERIKKEKKSNRKKRPMEQTVEDVKESFEFKQEKEVSEEEVSPRDQVVQEFEKELDNIAPTAKDKARLAKHKDTIKSAMNAQFGDIIDEAQKEVGSDVEIDPNEIKKQMAKSMEELMKTLAKAEKDLKMATQSAEEAEKNSVESLKKMVKGLAGEDIDQEGADVNDANQNVNKDQVFFSKTPPEKDENGNYVKPSQIKKANSIKKVTIHNQDDQKTVDDGGQTIRDSSSSSDEQDQNGVMDGESEMNEATKDEDVIIVKKERAEKDKPGEIAFSSEKPAQKLEVKIVKAGYYNENDGSLKFFTDDENTEFNNVLMAILGESPEQRAEEKRSNELEKGYNFKLARRKQDSQQPKISQQEGEKTDNNNENVNNGES